MFICGIEIPVQSLLFIHPFAEFFCSWVEFLARFARHNLREDPDLTAASSSAVNQAKQVSSGSLRNPPEHWSCAHLHRQWSGERASPPGQYKTPSSRSQVTVFLSLVSEGFELNCCQQGYLHLYS